MPTVTLSPVFTDQQFYPDGRPLNGGELFAYAQGTEDLQLTFCSDAGNIANPNPIVLMSDGTLPPGTGLYLMDGNYTLTLYSAQGALIATEDVSVA